MDISIKTLQALTKRLDTLNNILLKEKNRLKNVDSIIKNSIDNHIAHLKLEIKAIATNIEACINENTTLRKNAKLLKSIPGIGNKTTSKILANFNNFDAFTSAKQVAAFVRLNPQQAQSGISLNYSHLSKTGDAYLRKALYMPALVAIQRDPGAKLFYEKLISRGKAKKVAICAVMRKLLHVMYGVLKLQRPFNCDLTFSV